MTLRITTIASVLALTVGSAAVANMTDVEEQVRSILDKNGYEHIALNDLTEAEKANIFSTSTSEDSADVLRKLSAMNLAAAPSDMSDATLITITEADMTPEYEMQVKAELEKRGYSAADIASLTQADMASVYSVMTSEGAGDVSRLLSGLFAETYEVSPDYEEQVATELEKRGFTTAQISSLTQAEMAEIYTVMTSEGAGDVDAVLDGIFKS